MPIFQQGFYSITSLQTQFYKETQTKVPTRSEYVFLVQRSLNSQIQIVLQSMKNCGSVPFYLLASWAEVIKARALNFSSQLSVWLKLASALSSRLSAECLTEASISSELSPLSWAPLGVSSNLGFDRLGCLLWIILKVCHFYQSPKALQDSRVRCHTTMAWLGFLSPLRRVSGESLIHFFNQTQSV